MRNVSSLCVLAVFLIVAGGLTLISLPTVHDVSESANHSSTVIRIAGDNACNPRLEVCKS